MVHDSIDWLIQVPPTYAQVLPVSVCSVVMEDLTVAEQTCRRVHERVVTLSAHVAQLVVIVMAMIVVMCDHYVPRRVHVVLDDDLTSAMVVIRCSDIRQSEGIFGRVATESAHGELILVFTRVSSCLDLQVMVVL